MMFYLQARGSVPLPLTAMWAGPFSRKIAKSCSVPALRAQGGAKAAPKCAKAPPKTPKVTAKSRKRYPRAALDLIL